MNNSDTRPLMVSIWCITYNHEPYIRQCLDGFVMQKTNFRFEAIVHDDASTDGTAAIVREYAEKYPDIIKPILETENQYSKHDGSLERIMDEKCIGKYIAFCEGDDYWIDPFKLQKQVDFLESNTKYSLVHTRYEYYYDKEGIFISDEESHNEIVKILQEGMDIGYNILNNNKYRIQTMTALIRSDCYNRIKSYNDEEKGLFFMGDTQLWMNLLKVGGFKYLPINTSVYRISEGSVSKQQSKKKRLRFALSCEEMRYFYAKKNHLITKHFYWRYIKALFKYNLIDSKYVTNPRIIEPTEHSFYVKLLLKSGIIKIMSYLLSPIVKS